MSFIRNNRRYVPFEITPDYVCRKKMFSRVIIPWDEVVRVGAAQQDMITYDDNMIVFSSADGRRVSFAMLDVNHKEFSKLLREKFGIAEDWQTQLEVAGPGVWFTLYEKEAASL